MKKNKLITFSLILTLCTGIFAGCSNKDAAPEQTSDKPHIICTTFPEYDWVKELLGDHQEDFELTFLLSNGVDIHSYQPSAKDIAMISSCDLFIYTGGISESWIEDALDKAVNSEMQVISLIEVLGSSAKTEELTEGMEHDENEHYDETEAGHHTEDTHIESEHHDEEEYEHSETEYDEHVWLSLRNAQIFAQEIASALISLDNEHAADYEANCQTYMNELKELDAEYESVISASTYQTLLFGDRFPFRYLVDDYDLSYYAAFPGCSAETEASFETITFLSDKLNDLDLPAVMVIENSDEKIAKTLISNTTDKDQKVLILNSLQSVTDKDIADGATYLSMMEQNLQVLKEALN